MSVNSFKQNALHIFLKFQEFCQTALNLQFFTSFTSSKFWASCELFEIAWNLQPQILVIVYIAWKVALISKGWIFLENIKYSDILDSIFLAKCKLAKELKILWNSSIFSKSVKYVE